MDFYLQINEPKLSMRLGWLHPFQQREQVVFGKLVSADVFLIATNRVSFTPTMEIEEVIWFTPGQDRHIKLAPLTENHLLPLLKGV